MQQGDLSEQKTSGKRQAPTLIDYLAVVVRWKKRIALCTIGATLVVSLASLLYPDIYTAKTKFLPPQSGAGLLSAAMMQGALAAAIGGADILGESKSTKLYAEILKTEGLRDPIIERFQLQKVYRKRYREDVYKALNRYVTIQSGKEGIITVSVDDREPKRAAELANAFVEELKKLSAGMSRTGAGNTKVFLEERIALARDDLTKAENDLKGFQNKYKTVDASQQAMISVSAVAQLTAQLTSQEIQLSVLRRSFADTSQTVKAVQQAIAVLKEKIARLQGNNGSAELPGFEQLPDRAQQYLHLMRKFKTAEGVHDMLNRQYEMAKLNAENDVSTVQVIQKALVPERKSKPRRSIIVLISGLLSLALSIAGSLMLEGISAESREKLRQIFANADCRKVHPG
jgi:uncharacterized protein involved in exopolysaccharide biosynthesis